MENKIITFDKFEFISALSLILDVAEKKSFQHSRRAALTSLTISKKLGQDDNFLKDIYIATLLHDIGATESKKDYYHMPDHIRMHSQIGAQLVKKLGFNDRLSDFVAFHHAPWDGQGYFNIEKEQISLGARILCLADQVDMKYNIAKPYYEQNEEIIKFVKGAKGSKFDHDVADCFLELAEQDKFWLDYTFFDIKGILQQMVPSGQSCYGLFELEQLADSFAVVIDNYSKFTINHSRGVADLAESLADFSGLDQESVKKIKVAGLLHDLGKVSIPREILEKNGKLTKMEFQFIKAHSYYTKKVLMMVKGLEEIAQWAGNHHEKLNGKGYPEGEKKLAFPERLLAVVDIYQALVEDRPYREPMGHNQAIEIIQKMANYGELCRESLDVLIKLHK